MRIVWHGPLTHSGSVRLTCPPVAAMDAHAPTSTHAMTHYEGINARPAVFFRETIFSNGQATPTTDRHRTVTDTKAVICDSLFSQQQRKLPPPKNLNNRTRHTKRSSPRVPSPARPTPAAVSPLACPRHTARLVLRAPQTAALPT